MSARFIHIGDLHLGPNSRNVDRIAALEQIVSTEMETPVAAWLWPGDINHGRMTIEDRNVLAHYLTVMANHAPVVICYGNHDLPGDLDVFAKLKTEWPIYVINRPTVLTVTVAHGPGTAAIFVLPYPTRAGLVAAGVQSSSIVDAAREALNVIFMAAAAQLKEAADDGLIPLMIGHVNVAGALVSTGQPNIGAEIEVDEYLLGRFQALGAYIGLNHIHRGQTISGAWYPGSCCRLDWGELDVKRYLVVEFDRGERESPYTVTERPLDVAPMYHVEGELTRDGFTWAIKYDGETFENTGTDFTGAEVRVRYRYSAAEKMALDEALVRAPFAGAKRLELDPIAERSRAARAPEVSGAQTLEDKVQAFVRQSGVVWTQTLDAKLAALQVPDGAAFLTSVHQALSESAPAVPSSAPVAPDSPVGSDKDMQGALL